MITVPGGKMSYFDRYVGHLRHYTEASLRETLEAAGFRVLDVWRAGFYSSISTRSRRLSAAKALSTMSQAPASDISLPARLAMKVFGILFRLNLPSTPWGWQLMPMAVKDADDK